MWRRIDLKTTSYLWYLWKTIWLRMSLEILRSSVSAKIHSKSTSWVRFPLCSLLFNRDKLVKSVMASYEVPCREVDVLSVRLRSCFLVWKPLYMERTEQLTDEVSDRCSSFSNFYVDESVKPEKAKALLLSRSSSLFRVRVDHWGFWMSDCLLVSMASSCRG